MLTGKKLSVVGAGQMGEALIRGFLGAGVLQPDQILISDVNKERLEALKDRYGIGFSLDNNKAAREADIVVLAVKPQQMQQVVTGFKDSFDERKILISIAAGVTSDRLREYLDKDARVIRVMPNTPSLVGEGMSVISRGKYADDEAADIALLLFNSVGEAMELPEADINIVTAISGSGPAYFFLFVETLIEAAIKAGLSEGSAVKLARQTFTGSAKLLKESGKEPGELREMVTSPGGTTAAALQVFYNREIGFIVQEAVEAAIHRAGELA